jgi:hypothetical protein
LILFFSESPDRKHREKRTDSIDVKIRSIVCFKSYITLELTARGKLRVVKKK